jgi:hypothetical protein
VTLTELARDRLQESKLKGEFGQRHQNSIPFGGRAKGPFGLIARVG